MTARDECQNRHYRNIKRVFSDAAGKPVELRFEVAAQPVEQVIQ